MLRIGDFARISQVSIKTLHHYDEIGLLKPSYVDPGSRYRYYGAEQLVEINRIVALRELGFSLEHIKRILDANLTKDELRGMLLLRRAELQEQTTTIQTSLAQIEIRLSQLDQEGNMSTYEVIVKSVPPLKIAAAREVVPSPAQMRERCFALMDEVFKALTQAGVKETGLVLALYHYHESPEPEDGIDVEMAVTVSAAAEAQSGRVKVYDLPQVTVASAVYNGSYDALESVGQVYAAIGKWIQENGYHIVGPSRELYVQAPAPGSASRDGIMEIQFPIEKR
jgi:DNA-binding transcriptional MerR regulator